MSPVMRLTRIPNATREEALDEFPSSVLLAGFEVALMESESVWF
jgi:hypothetical protein